MTGYSVPGVARVGPGRNPARLVRGRVAAAAGAFLGAGLLAACGGPPTPPPVTSALTTAPPTSTQPGTSPASTVPASTSTTTTSSVPPATTVPATTTSVPSGRALPLPAGLGGREWNVVPVKDREVALTFDAGANADGVQSILATLQRFDVRATFFLTGDFVERFGPEARAVVAGGMRVGDHSITHPYFTKLSDGEIRDQVLGARREILAVTGSDPWPWFRFPYFDRDNRTIGVVNSVGFVPIGWTVDTLGWEGTSGGISVQRVVSRVLAALQPGEIIVMHCGSHPTDHSTLDADALPSLISALEARGYGFVTLDALGQ
jgi:peptidoglycan/xylan/chitin deacetylase (PgdA/CDA1 family)